MPQPSRLGGPVDALPLATAPARTLDAQTPSVRFKEIITLPAALPAETSSGEKSADGSCKVLAASYGGTKTLLVRATFNGETRYTALTVLDGFEKTMFDTYSKSVTREGDAATAEIIGEYESKDAALADARENCPG